MRKTIPLSILLCTAATLAQAGNIVPYTAPPMLMLTPPPPGATSTTPGLTTRQRSEVQTRDMLEQNWKRSLQMTRDMMQQQSMQSQTRQMQLQQTINNSREDPCQPGFHGLFGINLSKQLGMCGRQEEAQSLAPRTEPTRQAPPQGRYAVVAQPRGVPPMHNGPMSVYDRPYPYYKGN